MASWPGSYQWLLDHQFDALTSVLSSDTALETVTSESSVWRAHGILKFIRM